MAGVPGCVKDNNTICTNQIDSKAIGEVREINTHVHTCTYPPALVDSRNTRSSDFLEEISGEIHTHTNMHTYRVVKLSDHPLSLLIE